MAEARLDRFQHGLIRTSVVLAAGTLLLGLVVLFGWHTGNRTLVQVLPQFVPMQYNTALGFVFAGAALLALVLQRPRVAIAAGADELYALLDRRRYQGERIDDKQAIRYAAEEIERLRMALQEIAERASDLLEK